MIESSSIPENQKHYPSNTISDFFWVKNEGVQIVLEVENYLPATMVIDQLEFLSDNQLSTKLETKYRVGARMKKRLVVDCIPKEVGQLRVQGLNRRKPSHVELSVFEFRPAMSYLVNTSGVSFWRFPYHSSLCMCC